MNLFRRIGILLNISRITPKDVTQGIQQKDVRLLQFIVQKGAYTERVAATLGLGQIKARDAIPALISLLWDDFESVAHAAKRSLEQFLPNQQVEKVLKKAHTYWMHKKERSLKRNAISDHTEKRFKKQSPLINRSQMKRLEKVKNQLKKSIRLW
ncbi:MAG: HEAT repeat domain-containing protein [Saprospiraceae bacterium]|nr:HEAT repeat domain-containing protein [Saprospiraceae bacterium]